MLADSHTHLEMKEFDHDRNEVIGRAAAAGVAFILTVGTSLELSRKAAALASRHENIYAAIGIHPHDVLEIDNRTYDDLKELACQKKVIAYGEIGLDFFRNNTPRNLQINRFGEQLELARELNLPVIIHDREAHYETIGMIRASGIRRGIFHCFSGDYQMASRCLEMGFYISVPGTVTFAKAATIQDVVSRVPLKSLLIETDAPFLAPHPCRGKRNEPAFVIHTTKKIAVIKGLEWEEVAETTFCNTKKLFNM
mgnify:CR=1 FL=1